MQPKQYIIFALFTRKKRRWCVNYSIKSFRVKNNNKLHIGFTQSRNEKELRPSESISLKIKR